MDQNALIRLHLLNMVQSLLLAVCLLVGSATYAGEKQIALSFDDAPFPSTVHYETQARTDALIAKLKALQIPPVLIFANACRGDLQTVLTQLKKYRAAGHLIGNHTCNHPRLDSVGFQKFSEDAEKGDELLKPLFEGQKFFRFPYLNEGADEKVRDQMRTWLKKNKYRNGSVSLDNDDYFFTEQMNIAKRSGKKIDYKKVETLFVKHIIDAAEFYDAAAVKALGYSPKHVLLLHEMDATVMFLDSLVDALRKQGWKIIPVLDAYQDKMYTDRPKNTYATNGIIAQQIFQKTGEKIRFSSIENLKAELKSIFNTTDKVK